MILQMFAPNTKTAVTMRRPAGSYGFPAFASPPLPFTDRRLPFTSGVALVHPERHIMAAG